MEANTPWDDIPTENEAKDDSESPQIQPVFVSELGHSSPEPVPMTGAPTDFGPMLTGTTELPPGQLIYLQPPSNAAKVLGIIMIIYGVVIGFLTLISLLTVNILSVDELAQVYPDVIDKGKLVVFLNSQLAFALLSSIGFVLAGVWVNNFQRRGVILALLLTLIELVLQFAMMFIFPEFINEGLIAPGRGGVIAEGVFSSMFCGLIWAIPLMVANNGLDESKLFG